MTKAKRSRKFAVVAAVAIGAGVLLTFAGRAQIGLPRNALWEVVRNVCVPGQIQHRDPKPCLQVDMGEGLEKGFAILQDPRYAVHFFLIPTTPVVGIESPAIAAPNATNYFAQAWEARSYIDQTVHRTLPRDNVGLAINSAESRSQDQFHIHISCTRASVMNALHKNEAQIGSRWAPFDVPVPRRHYVAMWVPGDTLGSNNPFQLLAQGLPVKPTDMRNYTLVVVGLTRADGTKGFVVLADRADRPHDDSAGGEELLDSACRTTPRNR